MGKAFKKIIWLIIVAPVIYLIAIWEALPNNVPLHLNLKGQVDRSGSKSEFLILVIVLTVINIVVYLLLPKVYKLDPKRFAMENRQKLQRIAFSVSVFLAGIICLIIYTISKRDVEFGTRFALAGLGLLFAVIGNYMYTIKPNYFAGLRLSWTLNNEENWRKTHRLAAKVWVINGLLIACVSLFLPTEFLIPVIGIIMLIVILIPFIYSYGLYRKAKNPL